MGAYVQVQAKDTTASGSALHITVDHAARRATKRRLKTDLREAADSLRKTLGYNKPDDRYGLKLHPDWQKADADKPVVLYIHGLNAKTNAAPPWLSDLRDRGFPTGRFRYCNDGPLRASGEQLAAALETFTKNHPNRRLALVSFSMGGLVARAAVKDSQQITDKIDHLIMIAPPNHGSDLAPCAFLLEAKTYAARLVTGDPLQAFFRGLEDGLGEAATDLEPGSIFLRKLNAKPRNPQQVAYTIILGTGGPLPRGYVQTVDATVARAGDTSRVVAFFEPKLRDWFSFDELVEGRGDGAVSLASGRLEGVEDVVVLPFTHGDVLEKPTSPGQRRLLQVIHRRLHKN
jgi:pimeloyl-ACP methyl ester carboxylesterase